MRVSVTISSRQERDAARKDKLRQAANRGGKRGGGMSSRWDLLIIKRKWGPEVANVRKKRSRKKEKGHLGWFRPKGATREERPDQGGDAGSEMRSLRDTKKGVCAF